MSSALALSAVTAVLQYLLNNVYNGPDWVLGTVTVSAVAPDIIRHSLGGGDNGLQVNLFLHQVTPSAAWRNAGMPSLAPDGVTPVKNQPLALELHYLLTAYAREDSEAEALLGFAALLLHENPVLQRTLLSNALASLPAAFANHPLYTHLQLSGVADQIEMIKITPNVLGREEMAWLWTALKADYRPTYPFKASVVLIDPAAPTAAGLPVLSRNILVQPGPPAMLLEVQPPSGQAAPAPGDKVTLTGQSLAAATQVVLSNPRLGVSYSIALDPSDISNTAISFKIPEDPAQLPAGIYQAVAVCADANGLVFQRTNNLVLGLAPRITGFQPSVSNALGKLVTLNCDPQARPQQSVSLALNATAAPAQTFDGTTDTLSFQFPALSGTYLARLRVDGVESPINVDWTASPPAFLGPNLTV